MTEEQEPLKTEQTDLSLREVQIEFCEICKCPTDYCRFFPELHETDKPTQNKKGVTFKKTILIELKQRRKDKSTTLVKNLSDFPEIDADKIAKEVTKKLSVSATFKKDAGLGKKNKKKGTGVSNQKNLLIQGDAVEYISDLLIKEYKVPKTSIDIKIDSKKKKKDEGSEEETSDDNDNDGREGAEDGGDEHEDEDE